MENSRGFISSSLTNLSVEHEQRFQHNRGPFDMYLLLPLLAAIVFALGSMVFKRAYDEGAGVVHAVVVNNVLLAILFLPLFAFESKPVPWTQWIYPVATGAAFAAGHLLNVLSLRVGDVSVAIPLLGSKVIF